MKRIALFLLTNLAAFGNSGGGKSAWAKSFSTHPAPDDRIAALRGFAYCRLASVPAPFN